MACALEQQKQGRHFWDRRTGTGGGGLGWEQQHDYAAPSAEGITHLPTCPRLLPTACLPALPYTCELHALVWLGHGQEHIPPHPSCPSFPPTMPACTSCFLPLHCPYHLCILPLPTYALCTCHHVLLTCAWAVGRTPALPTMHTLYIQALAFVALSCSLDPPHHTPTVPSPPTGSCHASCK